MLLDSDAWDDADMASVIQYVRGNRKLNVPPKIREVLRMNKWTMQTLASVGCGYWTYINLSLQYFKFKYVILGFISKLVPTTEFQKPILMVASLALAGIITACKQKSIGWQINCPWQIDAMSEIWHLESCWTKMFWSFETPASKSVETRRNTRK